MGEPLAPLPRKRLGLSSLKPEVKERLIPKPLAKPVVDWTSGGEGSDVFMQMEGFEALVSNLQELPNQMQDAAGFEMANIAAEIIADARDNYVPFRFGNLRDSGESDEYVPNRGIKVTEIGMWFGAPGGPGGGISNGQQSVNARAASALEHGLIEEGLHPMADPSEYALDQHETLEYNHPGGGGPKYLERPFLAKVPTILPRIARAVFEAGGDLGDLTGLEPNSMEFKVK